MLCLSYYAKLCFYITTCYVISCHIIKSLLQTIDCSNTILIIFTHIWLITTSSNRNIFCVTGFHSQKPVTRSFDVIFDRHLNKRLSKQLRRQWFQMPLRSLWCHCNATHKLLSILMRCLVSWQLYYLDLKIMAYISFEVFPWFCFMLSQY